MENDKGKGDVAGNGQQPEEIAMIPRLGWSKGAEPDGEVDNCGIGSCRPKKMQIFATLGWFTIFYGISEVINSSLKVFLATQVTTLERQFGFSSQTMGALLICNDIGFIVFVLISSYLARRCHIPRSLALSAAVFGVACLVCLLPHPITQSTLVPPPVVTPNTSYSLEKLKLSGPTCMAGKIPPEILAMFGGGASGGGGAPGTGMGGDLPHGNSPVRSGGNEIGGQNAGDRSGKDFTAPSTNDASMQPSGKGKLDNNSSSSSRAPVPTTPAAPALPDFSVLANDPEIRRMASMLGYDLDKVMLMTPQQQLELFNQLPPMVKDMLMKRMAGTQQGGGGSMTKRAAPFQGMPVIDDKLIKEIAKKRCPFNTGPFFEDTASAAAITIGFIATGMILAGIARAPRLPFVAAYVDDNIPEDRTGVHLGFIMGMSAIGVAIAFGVGAASSTTYLTLEDTGMTIYNPRWLGAWWKGFLIYGLLALIVAVPLIFFPRRLFSTEKIKKKSLVAIKDCGGLLQGLVRLATNPVYVLQVLSNSVGLMAVAGMTAFLSKYMENQFSLPMWKASVILAMVNVAASALGSICGGFITSRWKMSPLGCLKMAAVLAVAVVVVAACAIGFGCQQPELNRGVGNSSIIPCSASCLCMDIMYSPVCGSDGNSYYSGCHAGCSGPADGKFVNCKCINDGINTAMPGLCPQPCNFLYAFCVVAVIGTFLLALRVIPAFLALMRSVKRKDAPLAIGVNGFFNTCLGFLPGPLLFGRIIDKTCTLWRSKCGPIGACAMHDIVQFRLHFHGTHTAILAVSAILSVAALILGLRAGSVLRRRIHDPEGEKPIEPTIST